MVLIFFFEISSVHLRPNSNSDFENTPDTEKKNENIEAPIEKEGPSGTKRKAEESQKSKSKQIKNKNEIKRRKKQSSKFEESESDSDE